MFDDPEKAMVSFYLDDVEVSVPKGTSIWEAAHNNQTDIPRLCHRPAKAYQPDGNCRACMVEVDGERTLVASCIRTVEEGMSVHTDSDRAKKARALVMELLIADQPEAAHDRSSTFWKMAEKMHVGRSRFPKKSPELIPELDASHVAMRVNLDACINCSLCVRACREVQVNDVIGMANRNHHSRIIFDQDDPMGLSTCVACGECVQACPTGALLPATVVAADQTGDTADFDDEVKTICPYCGVGCQISLKVKDNRIKFAEGVEGPSNEGRLCVKGRFGFDYIHHPHRLTKPLIRRDDAPPKGLNVDPANPLTHFREATWEEALDFAAGGLADLRKQNSAYVAGFGSAKCSNEEAYLFQKLIRQGFGHNNVDHCTRLCHASSVAALLENVGSGAVSATFNEIENADVAIIIGCNPTENHPVAATYFKQFAKRGGKLIVIDPRGQALKRHATHMLQFKPGTDVALLNGLMNVIVTEQLFNEQFISAHTENWTAMKEHLLAFDPEKMASICDIEAEEIRTVARTYAKANAAMIFWGMGISQHIHGTDNSRCLISLALMTGQIGRPGTGLHPLRGQNNVQGASDAGLIPMFLPDYRSVRQSEHRQAFTTVWNSQDFSDEEGLTVVEIMYAIHAGDIRGMYILGENPAMSDPDVRHARAALEKLQHLVVQDIFLTETAEYADVVLPSSTWYEKAGTVTNTNRQVQMGRPVIAPPGDAQEDWWIEVELAKRLGLSWTYTHPSEVFEEMALNMKSFENISWERLQETAVTYPSLHPEDPGQSIVFTDGFPRPDGRARFTPAQTLPPDELPDQEYPFVLITGRQLEHWHTGSMTRRSVVLDAVEPEATCSLHPQSLKNLGVAAGEYIKLTTRRGSITVQARADRSISEQNIFLPFAYVEAAANILTNPALDPFGKIPEYKFAAARAEKADK
ncbi:MAG: formate dehydrogenase subunit alpha [Aestuariivita sp.]|nr:formate dehydrogenase subunit alpha [Aestuariivita sp.]MCY4201075.1 formate dehydrogenase subunit alpha [Aestuariivita sp.]